MDKNKTRGKNFFQILHDSSSEGSAPGREVVVFRKRKFRDFRPVICGKKNDMRLFFLAFILFLC